MDSETAEIILRLQLQDISEIWEGRKGKEREGDPDPDIYLAFGLYRDELERDVVLLSDQRLAKSIGRAIHTDSSILATSKVEENVAIQDRQLACRLSGSRPETPLSVVVPEVDIDEQLAGQLAHWNVFKSEDVGDPFSDHETGESSRTASGQEADIGQCIACGDAKEGSHLMHAGCSHSYCIGCTNELFEYATKDESLFPPRCCRIPIPLSDARPLLNSGLIERFERKSVELGTPNPTYCHSTACSEFIPPENIDGDRATCRICSQVTCTICKACAHDGDCPEDPALESLMAVVAKEGYQRCYQCKRLVELDTGCVFAVHNFVISAVSPGSIALALAGTRTVYLHERKQ
ncbi:MAG: hypothetical protein M1840_005566 [Geoglossum simile]|nr:MAG: hypothetical protein M1840_005566 [Geoglossum simile]